MYFIVFFGGILFKKITIFKLKIEIFIYYIVKYDKQGCVKN